MTIAAQVDPLVAYELAVQEAETEIGFFARTFQRLRGRLPRVMREDFCGTSALSLAWVRSRSTRRAIAVDLDARTLSWVARQKLRYLDRETAARLRQVRGDVRQGGGETVDFVCAMNFSYLVFKNPVDMLAWMRRAYRELPTDGVLFMDLYGGPAAMQTLREQRDIDSPAAAPLYRQFVYEWHQESFDSLTNETMCHINFIFPDGSRMDQAFSYDWRLWSCPEVVDLARQAGFREVRFLASRCSEDGEHLNRYYQPKHLYSSTPSWWVYIIALK